MGLDAQVSILSGTTLLDLEDPGKYELVAVTTPGVSWRRRTVEGTYQHGRAFLGAVLDTVTLGIVVRVLGGSWGVVDARRSALFAALARRSYEVTVTVEGVPATWMCEPADITGGLDKFQAMANRQEYTLSIPAHPVSYILDEPT